MPYATTEDLKNRFGDYEVKQLAPAEAGDVDEAKVAAAIADAQAEIDSYIAQRYGELTEVPAVIVAVCCDMARYSLYSARATDEVKNRYQQRVAWLRDVAAGKATIGIPEKQASNTGFTVSVSKSASDRALTNRSLAHFTNGYRYR
ncbi:DUF1320 domain-containing protein [Shewanella avicenniae]|uniref:DUF1320 domain-containing protein n=1 Tax=Shewanella avicenniae TaxID=2814294 RepID=A0ABX7QNJ5_9GAMM|nr:DUF1320 domain-containing protein [Shewanella avicenniae]QSX32460.1 DUF1320 domain-containing protein [Shewanella avicenniae]